MVKVEQEKIDVENERDSKLEKKLLIIIIDYSLVAILHRLQLTEVTRQQIEEELIIGNKEKVEIIEQFQHV